MRKLSLWSLLMAIIFGASLTTSAKKVHTLGDSTMAPYDESATNTRGWGMYFGNFLTNGWTSVNYAKGGRDSRAGYNELWQNAKNSVAAGDYVLIQFAHNDEKYNGIDNLELQQYYTAKGDAVNAAAVKSDGRGTVPSTTYKACLKQIIDEVKDKGAIPVLVSAVCRCYFSGSTITRTGRHDLGDKYDAIVEGTLKTGLKVGTNDHSMDYSYQMKQLATELGVAFIDMTTATKNLYENYGTYDKCYAALFDKGGETDNTHYNLTGALTAARLCAQLMKEQGILADDIVIPTDLAFTPAAADIGDVYVGQSGVKELTLSGLGLTPAAGTATITATEGILLSADKQNWHDALEVSYENGTVIKAFYAKVDASAVGKFSGTVTATIGSKTAVAAVTMNAIELGGGDGVNITGSITYKLDKGGVSQGDDAVMTPNEMSAGFAAKKWSAGQALTVDGTQSYQGATGEANITQTRIYNGTGSSFPSSAVADNTFTLTLTPEDGFTFVPSKLSFRAARYGTDGGTISAAVEAGETSVVLVSNAGVNRGGKSLTIKSFSEEISGVTATADAPLRLNFSFLGLGNTKAMGLSDVVIEGTLVGAASQVTKYLLTTEVLPSVEAGSISRDPDMEQYKEGATVTLKAVKNFGYRFKEWQDGTGATVGTNATTTVTMDAKKTLKAVFEAVPVYSIKTKVTNDADRDGMGSITLAPNDHDGKYEAGTLVTATANESKVLKFLSWTDGGENAGAGATRDLTINSDMELVANYEVQDFIVVFDASKTQNYAYPTTDGYPFAADEAWDGERNAKASIVKVSDGSLCYTKDGGTPVVRNREGVVIAAINGLYQNGYRTTDIAWQYEFSTKGFTKARFVADMCAKNAATKKYKALIAVDGADFTLLKAAWDVTANVVNPIELELPASAMEKERVVIRITGDGTETYNSSYAFDKTFDGLDYCDHSESGVGNVYVLGDAVVATDGKAPEVTGTVPAANATGISATGRITVSFNERIEAAGSTDKATLNGQELTPIWSSRSVSFDYRNLDYGTQYTFTMPANYVQDRSGNIYMEPLTIVFTTMQRPKVAKGTYDFVVPDMGSIKEAIDAAQARANKNVRFRIFVKKGTHVLPAGANKHYKHTNSNTGDVLHDADHPDPITYVAGGNISFIGEDRDATIITQTLDNKLEFAGQFGTTNVFDGIGNSDVLQLTGSDYYFQDITVKSGMNDARGRNLAVQDKGTRTIYKNTLLYGYQDTWTSNNNNGLYYFEGGQVRGRTDYLCGKGDAYFNGVELRQLKGGYAAVPSTPANIGWVFKDCIISSDESGVNGNYTLGRPWGSGTPVAVFIDTKMNVVPSAIGWNEMSNGWPKRFAEWNSKSANGNAVDLSGRKKTFGDGHENNPRLTAEEAAAYSDMTRMFGDWQPTLLTEQAPVPTNLKVTGNTLTWDDSDYALLWAICRDGQVVDFTTVPTYTATQKGIYSIRAANEMGGLSAASASIEVGDPSGLTVIQRETSAVLPKYNLKGQCVTDNYRGIVISHGKKVVAK